MSDTRFKSSHCCVQLPFVKRAPFPICRETPGFVADRLLSQTNAFQVPEKKDGRNKVGHLYNFFQKRGNLCSMKASCAK
jgi:hypothetical protein